ncbi:MAG: hypothetical protein WAW41_01055 [Methylobacter sp.]
MNEEVIAQPCEDARNKAMTITYEMLRESASMTRKGRIRCIKKYFEDNDNEFYVRFLNSSVHDISIAEEMCRKLSIEAPTYTDRVNDTLERIVRAIKSKQPNELDSIE